ncbi:hypothetical protein [Eudoraea chungangensis]|uniref:hypothetical protein n=1 Tax=Eudoraea chungangensis TaxID=1481905 RepID=UPI0023ED7C32|nr:hypothetical protein [Eudoraea chungangensis]
MNKVLMIVLIVIALGLIIYNASLVDYSNPFEGDSTVAVIGIVVSLCAIILLLIFWTSKKIQNKIKDN